MKYKIIYISWIMFSLLFISCTESETAYFDTETPVVESYLFSEKNITHFKLTKAIPYTLDGSGELEYIEVENIKISNSDTNLILLPIDSLSGYYALEDTNFRVLENQSYSFEFEFNNEVISGSTIIPTKPRNIEISESTIYATKIEEGEFPGSSSIENDVIEITWDNSDESYYYLKIECVTENPELINEMMSDMIEEDIENFKTTVSNPENSDIYNIRSRSFYFFGNYRAVLFHINQEYVNLFEDIDNSTTSMSEPKTNITNGKGIFTGIATDTIFFSVREAK